MNESEKKKIGGMALFRILWNAACIVFYFAYCAYLFLSGRGNIVVNYILLVISILYAVTFIVVTVFVHGNTKKLMGGISKKAYKAFRRIMLLYNAVIVGSSVANLFGGDRSLFMGLAVGIILAFLVFQILIQIVFEIVKKSFKEALRLSNRTKK